jgi:hypothetical protein
MGLYVLTNGRNPGLKLLNQKGVPLRADGRSVEQEHFQEGAGSSDEPSRGTGATSESAVEVSTKC